MSNSFKDILFGFWVGVMLTFLLSHDYDDTKEIACDMEASLKIEKSKNKTISDLLLKYKQCETNNAVLTEICGD